MPIFLPKIALIMLIDTPYSLISMSTPAGRSRRIRESTVLGVGDVYKRQGFVGIHAHDGVEAIHLAVLLIDDVVDGVLQPQAREQQRGAAGEMCIRDR